MRKLKEAQKAQKEEEDRLRELERERLRELARTPISVFQPQGVIITF